MRSGEGGATHTITVTLAREATAGRASDLEKRWDIVSLKSGINHPKKQAGVDLTGGCLDGEGLLILQVRPGRRLLSSQQEVPGHPCRARRLFIRQLMSDKLFVRTRESVTHAFIHSDVPFLYSMSKHLLSSWLVAEELVPGPWRCVEVRRCVKGHLRPAGVGLLGDPGGEGRKAMERWDGARPPWEA